MEPTTITGVTLVTGFVVFMIGAGGWRMAYEQPMLESLRVIADDRRRRAWIHLWMVPALFLTPAGIAGVAVVVTDPGARVLAVLAATVYGVGAVCWIASLLFRLTVVPWAADHVVAEGDVPAGFPALDRWASSLYAAHMVSAYVASAVLGTAVLADDVLGPGWMGWGGLGFGVLWSIGIIGTRFSGPFNPPFWAHLFTGAIGLSLLL